MLVLIQSPWNSLEVARVIIALLTPVLIIGVGLFINKSLMKIEHNLWRNQKLIEKRITIYDDLVPDFNDLLCYFTHVGDWKKFKPTEIVEMKRRIDRKIHLSAPLFNDEYFEACTVFMNLCFETYTGSGKDAMLKTTSDDRKIAFGKDWAPEWEQLFCSSEKSSSWKEIRKAYSRIIKIFAEEMGLNPETNYSIKSRLPRVSKE